MTRVVLDQGLPRTAAAILRTIGWDALHTGELGMQEASDAEILTFAGIESRSVVTLDRDFPQIMALTAASRPSVILIRHQHLRAKDVAALLADVCREYEAEIEQGCVLTVGHRGVRIRRLPLGR